MIKYKSLFTMLPAYPELGIRINSLHVCVEESEAGGRRWEAGGAGQCTWNRSNLKVHTTALGNAPSGPGALERVKPRLLWTVIAYASRKGSWV